MKSTKETLIAVAIVVAAYFIIIRLFVGCTPAKESLAEATYLGQQLQCVDRFTNRRDIDECRTAVRRSWGVAETVTKDGGAR